METNKAVIRDIYREYFYWRSKFLGQINTPKAISLTFIDPGLEELGANWQVQHKITYE